MNHFMLPESDSGNWNETGGSSRYGNFAMDALIDGVLETGCSKSELEIKLFGGAELYHSSVMIGSRNIEFVKGYMERNGLRPAAQDLGGSWARKIIYTPATGVVKRQVLHAHARDEMIRIESNHSRRLNLSGPKGKVIERQG